MNKNFVKIIKICSVIASVIGVIGSSWADSKENEETLKKLVIETIEKGK